MNKFFKIFIGFIVLIIAIVVLAVLNFIIWNSAFLGFILGFAFASSILMAVGAFLEGVDYEDY